jgi:hypothetical protein
MKFLTEKSCCDTLVVRFFELNIYFLIFKGKSIKEMRQIKVYFEIFEGEKGSEDSCIFMHELFARLKVRGIKSPKRQIAFSPKTIGLKLDHALEVDVHPHNYGSNLGATIEFRIPGNRTYMAELKIFKHLKPGSKHALDDRDHNTYVTMIEKGILEGLELLDSWQQIPGYQPKQRVPVPAV